MIIPTPAFSLYDTVTRMVGAVPVPVDTTEDGFQLTAAALEAALTSKTKVLILNSPNNPTGVVYTPEHLAAIDRLTQDRDLFVLCDDVYWGLSPCPTFSQLTHQKDRILAVQSFSKPYAMTGWRVGYLMAPLGDSGPAGSAAQPRRHLRPGHDPGGLPGGPGVGSRGNGPGL